MKHSDYARKPVCGGEDYWCLCTAAKYQRDNIEVWARGRALAGLDEQGPVKEQSGNSRWTKAIYLCSACTDLVKDLSVLQPNPGDNRETWAGGRALAGLLERETCDRVKQVVLHAP